MPTISDQSFVKALLKLPWKIARQILNDVPFYRVLNMTLCLNDTDLDERFKELLLSLPPQQIFIANKHTLYFMIALYKLYLELLQVIRPSTKLPHLEDSPLFKNFDITQFYDVRSFRRQRKDQCDWLSRQVHLMLRSLNWWKSFRLPVYEDEGYRDSFMIERCKKYWQTVREKNFHFATKRSTQLQVLADLFRKYPTFLKLSSDPGYDARPNHTHIVSRLEQTAKQYQKHLLKHHFRRPSNFYRHDHLPVMPLDKYLLLFIHTLAQYPHDCSCSYLEVNNHKIVGLSIKNGPQSLIYPPHIKEDICRVVRGIEQVYISQPEQVYTSQPTILKTLRDEYVLMRTKLTPNSDVHKSKRPEIPTCRLFTGK